MQQGQVKVIGNYSYNLKHCLGEGAYGKVYQGLDTTTNAKVAIKKLDLKSFERDTYLKQSIIQEIEILKKFSHRNIVRFIDLISTQRSLYIITEFCKDGDLRELMTRKKFSEAEAWKALKQILQGFKELVSNAVIHRDLKPANILSHEGVYKIADFGFAKYVDNFSGQLLRSCVGSPLYMAPQILARKPYSTKCDIWSIGVIYFEMIFSDVPWKGRDERDLLKNILSVPLNYKKGVLSAKSEDFLRKTLTIEENDRISWDRVFEIFEVTASGSELRMQTVPSTKPAENKSQQPPERKKSIFQGQGDRATSPYGSNMTPAVSAPIMPMVPQTPSVKAIRNEIIFRNFVLTAELYTKYQNFRNSGSQLLVEKIMICLSKSNINSQSTIIGLANQAMLSVLRKELESYTQFHSDLIDTLIRNGQLVHCEREFDIQVRETAVNETEQDKIYTLLYSLIKQFISEQIEENRRNLNRALILTLDNLLDVLIIHRKTQRLQEIDYDQLNAEKSEEEDSRRMAEVLIEKIKSI